MTGDREAIEASFAAAVEAARAIPSLSADTTDRLVDELLDRSPGQRWLMVRNRPQDFGRPEVCWRIIHRCEALRHADPAAMLRLAELGVQVAETLPVEGSFEALVIDIQAEALAVRANALRIVGDHAAAAAIWPRALALSKNGTGDPLLRAKIYRLWGSLRVDQRRFLAALLQYHRARRLYLQVGDRHEAGKVLLLIAQIYREKRMLRRALDLTELGASLLEPGREVELHLSVAHNLACLLAESGAIHPLAEQLAEEHGQLEVDAGSPAHIRMRWLEASILARAGRPIEARRGLRAVCDAFQKLELELDAALATLDLAALLAETGSPGDVENLTEAMYPVFTSRRIPREAAATLELYIEAVNRRQASAARIRELAAELQALRRKS